MSSGLTDASVLEGLSASSSPSEHADWLELRAVAVPRGSCSFYELTHSLKVSGTADAVCDDVSEDEELITSKAEDAFAELDDREHACGGQGRAYPFSLSEQTIELRDEPAHSIYMFLLLLSAFGKDVGPDDFHAERVFEHVCSQAAASYFGAPDPNVGASVFGFPRSLSPTSFAEALDDLCNRLGEGGGSRDRPKRKDQKDAKLDIVVWRGFPDRRPAKLIAFGQCATGRSWADKCSELDPQAWCSHWMMDNPLVIPTKLFFVPHRIDAREWTHTGRFGGIVFDRCRIALHSARLDTNLKDACTCWSRHVIRDNLLGSTSSRPPAREKQRANRTRSSSRK